MDFYAEFAAHYEQVFPFRPRTADFLRRHLPGSGRVLDLGCGPGHHAGALAEQGLEVLGVDLDPAMIAAARRGHPRARFEVADITTAPALAGTATGAYCIGNVLSHVEPAALPSFLESLAGCLPPGAPWLVQTVNIERMLPLDQPFDFPTLDAGDGLTFERRYEPLADGAVTFVTRLLRERQELFAGSATLWPLIRADLARHHAAAGFALSAEYGGFAGEPFEPQSSGGLVQVYRRHDTNE